MNKLTEEKWWVSGPDSGRQFNIQSLSEHIALVSRTGPFDSTAAERAIVMAKSPQLLDALGNLVDWVDNCFPNRTEAEVFTIARDLLSAINKERTTQIEKML